MVLIPDCVAKAIFSLDRADERIPEQRTLRGSWASRRAWPTSHGKTWLMRITPLDYDRLMYHLTTVPKPGSVQYQSAYIELRRVFWLADRLYKWMQRHRPVERVGIEES